MESDSFTHCLCTNTVFALLAYGNDKETEVFRRGSAAPQILEQGGNYFRDKGVQGIRFIEEPAYYFDRAGKEGQDKTNMLKRQIEVGRHYIHTFESMVASDPNVSFKESSPLGYLNLDSQNGCVDTQCYLELLDACSMFNADTGELSAHYNALANLITLGEIADEMQVTKPNKDQGGRVDPFIAFVPGSDPRVVHYLGEQDCYYTSQDDQDMIVERAIDLAAKSISDKDVNAIRKMLRYAEDWYNPTDFAYTEAFLTATYLSNMVGGNEEFTEYTKLPGLVGPEDATTYLGVEDAVVAAGAVPDSVDWGKAVVKNVESPGYAALFKRSGLYSMTPKTTGEIAVDNASKAGFTPRGGIAANAAIYANALGGLSAIYHMAPPLTTAMNLRQSVNARFGTAGEILSGAKHLWGSNEMSGRGGGNAPFEANPAADNETFCRRFGFAFRPNFFPGFSTIKNMQYLAGALSGSSVPRILGASGDLKSSIPRGMSALNRVVANLTGIFSPPDAPNFYAYDAGNPHTSELASNSTISQNIMIGVRPEIAYQKIRWNGYTAGVRGMLAETVGRNGGNADHHERFFGLETLTELLAGERYHKASFANSMARLSAAGGLADDLAARLTADPNDAGEVARKARNVATLQASYTYTQELNNVIEEDLFCISRMAARGNAKQYNYVDAMRMDMNDNTLFASDPAGGDANVYLLTASTADEVKARVRGGNGPIAAAGGRMGAAAQRIPDFTRDGPPGTSEATLIRWFTGGNGRADINGNEWAKTLIRAIIVARDHVVPEDAMSMILQSPGAAHPKEPFDAAIMQAANPLAWIGIADRTFSDKFFYAWTQIAGSVDGDFPAAIAALNGTIGGEHLILAQGIFTAIQDANNIADLVGWSKGYYRRTLEEQGRDFIEVLERAMQIETVVAGRDNVGAGAGGAFKGADLLDAAGSPLDQCACFKFGVALSSDYFKNFAKTMRVKLQYASITEEKINDWAGRNNGLVDRLAVTHGVANNADQWSTGQHGEFDTARRDGILCSAGKILKIAWDAGENFSHFRPSNRSEPLSEGVAGRTPSRFLVLGLLASSNFGRNINDAYAPAALGYKEQAARTLSLEDMFLGGDPAGNNEYDSDRLAMESCKRNRYGGMVGTVAAGLMNVQDPMAGAFDEPDKWAKRVKRGGPDQDRRGQHRAPFKADSSNHPDFSSPWWSLRRKAKGDGTGFGLLRQFVTKLYCGAKVHRSVFREMYKANIPPPLGFLVADPFIRLMTSALVFVASSATTGRLSWCLPDFSVAYDADRKMYNHTLTFMMAAMVERPENVLIIPDAVFEGYMGGGNGSLIRTGLGDNELKNVVSASFMNLRNQSVDYNCHTNVHNGNRFVMALGASRKRREFSTFLTLSGSIMDSNIGLSHWIPQDLIASVRDGRMGAPYDSAYLNQQKFKFSKACKTMGPPLPDCTSYAEDRVALEVGNMVTAMTDQWAYCKATGQHSQKIVSGQGPLGALCPGSVKSLRGGATTVAQVKRTGNSDAMSLAY